MSARNRTLAARDPHGFFTSLGVPYTDEQIDWLESLSDDEVLNLALERRQEVTHAEDVVAQLRASFRDLILYLYAMRPELPMETVARRTHLRLSSLYETYLGNKKPLRQRQRPEVDEGSGA